MQTKEQRETEVILAMKERLEELEKAVESIMRLHKQHGEYAFIDEIGEILEKVRKRS